MKHLASILVVLASTTSALAQGTDTCGTPTSISGNGPFPFNNTSATGGTEGQPVCGITVIRDVWFTWTAPTTDTYVVTTCGQASIDSVLGVYTGTSCPSGSAIACNDDACGVQSSASFSATQGASYLIQLGSYPATNGGTGTFTISPPVPCGPATGPDVITGDITGPANYPSGGGLEALSLGTTSCNLGSAGVGWHSSTNQHPVIGGELYRFKVVAGAGRFEQVGLSWLKHGFFAESENLCCTCAPTDGTNLGVGCSDPYTADRNGTQSLLGPRYQVNAHTGLFTYPPPNPSGGNTGRLQVDIGDLETSSPGGTRYFGNSQYIAPDDATSGNGNNNCSYREITVTGSGSAWNFGFSGGTQRETPAIQAWPTCESGVTVNNVQIPSEGLLMIGFKVTPLGGGQFHYEYALYNMNSDDSVRSFSVPIAAGVTISNPGFHDVTYRGGDGVGGVNYDGTDWSSSITGAAVSWSTSTFVQNANANAIRWGTTYNFRFDADAPPTAGDATLGLYKSGGSITSQVEVPGVGSISTFCFGDGSGVPCPCSNNGAAGHGCENSSTTGGAHLTGAGTTSPDTVVLTSVGEMPTALSVFFQGTASVAATNYGDGLRCVAGTLKRLYSRNAVGGQVFAPHPGDPSITARSAALGDPISSGSTRYYSVSYRDPDPSFCPDPTGSTFNTSNAVSIVW